MAQGRRRKRSSRLAAFIVRLLPLLMVVTLLLLANREELIFSYQLDYAQYPPQQQEVIEVYKQARQLLNLSRYDEALQLSDQLVSMLENNPAIPDRIRAAIYYTKALTHDALWQHVETKQALEKARRLATGQQLEKINSLLRSADRVVEGFNSERDGKNSYLATPFVGPASHLEGHVLVIKLFLEDGGPGQWSLRKQDFVHRQWQTASQWLTRNAHKYARSLSFTERSFIINRNPVISRLRVGSMDEGFSNARKVVQLAVHELGARSVAQFIERLRKQENADQAVLQIYIERDRRSFARRCRGRCGSDSEYTYIFESARSKDWQSMEYAQAHESLHLFGAADLYNIKNAKFYAPRDIMNYPSRYLSASTIEPLTAYAIGILRDRPATPFPVTNN